jgi:hypothetical protein
VVVAVAEVAGPALFAGGIAVVVVVVAVAEVLLSFQMGDYFPFAVVEPVGSIRVLAGHVRS